MLASSFEKIPLLSLRIGDRVGSVVGHLINPHSLHIDALWVKVGGFQEPHLLLPKDIRELTLQGIVIDDLDVVMHMDDAHRLKKIIDLKYNLIDKKVVSSGLRIGKVADYSIDHESFYIRKLYIAPTIWKALQTNSLIIDRSQIIEVSHEYVRVKGAELPSKKTHRVGKEPQPAFVPLPSANTSSISE